MISGVHPRDMIKNAGLQGPRKNRSFKGSLQLSLIKLIWIPTLLLAWALSIDIINAFRHPPSLSQNIQKRILHVDEVVVALGIHRTTDGRETVNCFPVTTTVRN